MQHSSYYSLQAVVYFFNPSYFFHRERERDCFQPHVFREYKHKSAHFCVWWKYQIMPTKTPCIPPKTPNTPTKIPMWFCVTKLVFFREEILSQISALFLRTFYKPRNAVVYKNLQIWGMSCWVFVGAAYLGMQTKCKCSPACSSRELRCVCSCLLLKSPLVFYDMRWCLILKNYIQGGFLTPPKKLKYVKPKLGESTLT